MNHSLHVLSERRFFELQRERLELGLSLLSLTPRLLIPLGSLVAALLGATSCVPATRFEEAESAAEVETEARRRASLELEAQKARIQALEAELRARDEKLDARDKNLEEEKLEKSTLEKQRDDSTSLVEQLRGELARVGDHLQTFSNEKTRLERELAAVRAPGSAVDPLLVTLARDLGLAVGASQLTRSVSVSTRGGALVVAVRADAVFEGNGAELRALAPAAFDAAGRALAGEPRLSATLVEVELDPGLPAQLRGERRARIEAALLARGLDQRLRFETSAPTGEGAPLAYELVLRVADRPAPTEPVVAPRPE